jgi:hypothetical protein
MFGMCFVVLSILSRALPGAAVDEQRRSVIPWNGRLAMPLAQSVWLNDFNAARAEK